MAQWVVHACVCACVCDCVCACLCMYSTYIVRNSQNVCIRKDLKLGVVGMLKSLHNL